MSKYDHKKIESKWQEYWAEKQVFKTKDSGKDKFYVLDMFPYPSGVGLHVGHPKGYIATDVVSRYKRMNDFEVLHPMGWDAFGLPAENYALKNKIHPAKAVEINIQTFKEQLSIIGLDYDWSREINTTDPSYYKWTQWIFLQIFKKGLAYQSEEPINWCPSCKTGIANEDLEHGKCEQCGSEVQQRPIRQWVLRITDYADRLLEGLDKLDWEDSIKEMQRNWIGRSEGAIIKFQISRPQRQGAALAGTADFKFQIEGFTTQPDTLFGATYMVLAPEHELVASLLSNQESIISNQEEVDKYIKMSLRKTELERQETKEKTGVELKGIKAINPATKEEIPIWIADYVLASYGTGAIMAVPAHDERDFEFAKKYNLEIIKVIDGVDIKNEVYTGEGIAINSGEYDGLATAEVKEKIIKWLEKEDIGKKAVNYKMRDWVFSRQRYWGEPIPLIHCEKCGVVPVPEDELPVELPEVKSYEPTGTGESPLANIDQWVNTKCPQCGGNGKRETNTMPQWAGSCWYYLRYIDTENNKHLVDKKLEKHWSPVDLYVGGAEHATRHLIYARFWHKFLFDIKVVDKDEPFQKLKHVGLILADDGRKMSKRWGNVINPDEIVEKLGADTLRVYEMFMGPFNQAIAWNTESMIGVRKFLERVWKLYQEFIDNFSQSRDTANSKSKRELHKLIKSVTFDIENMKFNTAIAKMMEYTNFILGRKSKGETGVFNIEHAFEFLKLLHPFAPHITSELFEQVQKTDQSKSGDNIISLEPWPEYEEKLAKEDEIELVIQINGKVRDKMKTSADISEKAAKKLALNSDKIKPYLENKEPKKVIFVQGKLVNIVA